MIKVLLHKKGLPMRDEIRKILGILTCSYGNFSSSGRITDRKTWNKLKDQATDGIIEALKERITDVAIGNVILDYVRDNIPEIFDKIHFRDLGNFISKAILEEGND